MSRLDPVAAVLEGSGRPIGRPLLTSVADDGDTEALSGRTIGLWVAKTANLVRDDLGLGPGDTVAVRLPCHWQAWVWAWAASWAGADVDLAPPGRPADDGDLVVTTATHARDALDSGTDVVALSLLPLARPGPVPPGALDYDTEVRAHGDRFAPSGPCGSIRARGAGPAAAALLEAGGHARPAGPGDVVLTARMPEHGSEWTLLTDALAAGASLVLAPGAAEAARLSPALARTLATLQCTHALPDAGQADPRLTDLLVSR